MGDHCDDDRIRTLHATRLLDSAPELAFDRLTRLAANLLGAPVALVSLVDEHRQFFKSAFGLKEPWASRRETPLTHSFCRHATRDRAPLIVNDAREHPALRDNEAIRDLDVVAYAGVPLLVSGEAIGAFCVIDDRPRIWSDDEQRLLVDLAASVVSEIELRVALRSAEEQRALTDAIVESLADAVLAVAPTRTFLVANGAARRAFANAEAGLPLPADWSTLHRSFRPDGSALSSEEGALGRGLRGDDTNGLVSFSTSRGALHARTVLHNANDDSWVAEEKAPYRANRRLMGGRTQRVPWHSRRLAGDPAPTDTRAVCWAWALASR
jgi:hypothetical protein